MSWELLAFNSVFFFTSLNLLQKVIATESKNSRAMAILFNSIAATIALFIFTITNSFKNLTLPNTVSAWFLVIIASFFYAMFERGRFIAAKLLDASVLITIANISVLVAFAGSLFLYSEPLTFNKLFGSVLIIGALFLVSFNDKVKKSDKKGLLIAIVISVMLGLAWMLDKLGTQYFNANTYNILVWTIPIVFIYFPKIKFSIIKAEFKLVTWKVFILSGLNVVGYLMQLKALEIGEATRVIPIVQTSTLFTIFFGIILLKEREHITRKVIAGLMAIAGAYFLI